MTRCMVLAAISAAAFGGCAGLLRQSEAGKGSTVTEAEIAQSQREAEAQTQIANVHIYALNVAGYAKEHPSWDSSSHVSRLEQLLATCAAGARDFERSGLESVRAEVRLAARDVTGARSIYETLLERNLDTGVLKEYLIMLKDFAREPRLADECRKWYGAAKSDQDRFGIAETCKGELSSKDDDGLGWLSPEDQHKVRDELVIRSAEVQDQAGDMERAKARKEGRLFTATYRGPVKIRIQSRCADTSYLAHSGTPRGPLGNKHAIGPNSIVNVVEIPSDHLLWLLDANGHRVSVARIGTWDDGLLITSSCRDIIPMGN